MEYALVFLMLLLVFKGSIANLIKRNIGIVSANAESLAKYAGASAVLALTVAVFPTICVAIYMRTEGFFAYELYSAESRSFGVLSANIFLNYCILSLGLFGIAVFSSMKTDRWLIIGMAVVNALLIVYFLLLAWTHKAWIIMTGVSVIAAMISLYLRFWISSGIQGKAKYWWAPLVPAAILGFAPLMAPDVVAKLTASSLAQMKVGGMAVEILDDSPLESRAGEQRGEKKWLVLRTPEMLYLKDREDDKSITLLKADRAALRYPVD